MIGNDLTNAADVIHSGFDGLSRAALSKHVVMPWTTSEKAVVHNLQKPG